MFPRWVQPSAPGTPAREPRLEEPLLRGPARGGPGECVCAGAVGKGLFGEVLFSRKSCQPREGQPWLLLRSFLVPSGGLCPVLSLCGGVFVPATPFDEGIK